MKTQMKARAGRKRRPALSRAMPYLLLILMLALVACAGDDGASTTREAPSAEQGGGAGLAEQTRPPAASGDFDAWLEQLRSGAVAAEQRGQTFDWGRGYLVYYAPVETFGVDNLIYNALTVHKRLDTGELTADALGPNERNLLEMTEGIRFDPDTELTQQVAQSPEIKDAILARIVDSQRGLSPEEALDSNEVIGVVALPSPEDLGGKYLVYAQETPDADFEFLGVVIVVDATTPEARSQETYSFLGWQDLPLLGDASGPFWEQLPAGVSGDPANTAEGRPGVLLVSERTYAEMTGRDLD